MSILRFIKATGLLGGGSVLLAILLFAISIYEHLITRNVSAYWLVFLAGVFFAAGSYRAWVGTDAALVLQSERIALPRLNIDLVRAFFDVVKVDKQNSLQTLIYVYLRVTNLSDAETLIKDGELIMTVDGRPYAGRIDEFAHTGNALEHATNFKLGGEVLTDAFSNNLSRFPRLIRRGSAAEPLQRGISREGFVTFNFPDLSRWNPENIYLIEATGVVVSLRDSFDRVHSTETDSHKISNGTLTTSDHFSLVSGRTKFMPAQD